MYISPYTEIHMICVSAHMNACSHRLPNLQMDKIDNIEIKIIHVYTIGNN